MTTPDALRRLRTLFDEAMELPAAHRDGWLAALPDTTPELRSQLRDMLSTVDATDVRLHLDHLVSSVVSDASAHAGAMASPTRLGPYEVVRLIGRGGMGEVYEAVRADDQYRKRVAIKVVQGAFATELTLARFRRERQILASLEHRNIATLLDGGVTAEGRPFLVMEFVEGLPITHWCDDRALSVRDRMQLFRQVCAAVRHAHGRLIVHRDLKPGNILVTADGSVKLLDFGIATLLASETDDPSMPATAGLTHSFTLEYASPEQVRGDAPTTATDVYALGVVLFELVAGRRPFVKSPDAPHIEQRILSEDALTPSSVVTDRAAEVRGDRTADRLRKQLRGDIDVMTLKALSKPPERRYATVDAFDEDIRRWLGSLPISARAERWYRVRRFVRRYRGTVTTAVLLLLALIGGVVATTRQAHLARAEQAKSAQVAGFLRELLSSVKPVTGGRDVPVSEVLEAAAQRIDVDKTQDIDVRIDLEMVIGESFQSLGRLNDAERHFEHARIMAVARGGADGVAVALALNALGSLELTRGQLPRAESLFSQALTIHSRSPSAASDSMIAIITDNLGSVAHSRGDEPLALQLHRRALKAKRRLFGSTSDAYAYALNNVAVGLGEQGRLAEAETLHREVVRITRANHRGPHPLVAEAENALASVLDFEGKSAAADSMYSSVVATRRLLLGPEHSDYASSAVNYAGFLFDQRRYADAMRLAQEIASLRGKSLPESHTAIATSLQTVGRSLDQMGRFDDARAALEESLALRQKYVGMNSWLVASSESALGEHFTLAGDYARAERLLLHADTALRTLLGAENPRVKTNRGRLDALYVVWKRSP